MEKIIGLLDENYLRSKKTVLVEVDTGKIIYSFVSRLPNEPNLRLLGSCYTVDFYLSYI